MCIRDRLSASRAAECADLEPSVPVEFPEPAPQAVPPLLDSRQTMSLDLKYPVIMTLMAPLERARVLFQLESVLPVSALDAIQPMQRPGMAGLAAMMHGHFARVLKWPIHEVLMRWLNRLGNVPSVAPWLRRFVCECLSQIVVAPLGVASTVLALNLQPPGVWQRMPALSAMLWGNALSMGLPQMGVVLWGRRIAPVTSQLLSLLLCIGSPTAKLLWDWTRQHGVLSLAAGLPMLLPVTAAMHGVPALSQRLFRGPGSSFLAASFSMLASYPFSTVRQLCIVQPHRSAFEVLRGTPTRQLFKGFWILWLRMLLVVGLSGLCNHVLAPDPSDGRCSRCGAAALTGLPCGHLLCLQCSEDQLARMHTQERTTLECPLCGEPTTAPELQQVAALVAAAQR
eukprot:TRINITY_DN6234_c0_g1_i1.p1 TRINITY_DN6234_c0_g1~~TRINITY_DN6234_c0_g1_i1.p1  ORF type:complete len:397 (-),score=76.36 TRINITY_DN6234_c0_g1_i1:161-1351(-)